MVLLGVLAPLFVSASSAVDFSLLDARQGPSWHHLFGTTDQGSDVFAQVAWGARRSLLLGAAAGALATVIATSLGIFAAYVGGFVDDLLNLVTNVFFVIPTIPLLDRHHRVPAHARHARDDRSSSRRRSGPSRRASCAARR